MPYSLSCQTLLVSPEGSGQVLFYSISGSPDDRWPIWQDLVLVGSDLKSSGLPTWCPSLSACLNNFCVWWVSTSSSDKRMQRTSSGLVLVHMCWVAGHPHPLALWLHSSSTYRLFVELLWIVRLFGWTPLNSIPVRIAGILCLVTEAADQNKVPCAKEILQNATTLAFLRFHFTDYFTFADQQSSSISLFSITWSYIWLTSSVAMKCFCILWLLFVIPLEKEGK